MIEQLAVLFGRPGIEAPRPAASLGSDTAQAKPLRILVAEDNRVNQIVVEHFLKRLGYRADLAIDGNEVLEALARQCYDVILMDVQMPVMDGYEATRRIHLSTDAAPYIIAVTANSMAEDEQRCLDAGMDDYLSKPIEPQKLAEALDRGWSRRQRSSLHPETRPS